MQLDLFTDYARLEEQKRQDAAADARERNLQMTALGLHGKFGKNALLKGMNLREGATTIRRNSEIGGHRAGTDAPNTQKGREQYEHKRNA